MTCLVRSGLKIGCKIVRSGFTVHQPAASCLFRGFAQRVPAEPGRRDARKAQFQAVDPSLVNVHHAAMAIDAQSKAMIRQLAEGMKLLEQDRYRAARTRFSEWDGDDAHEASIGRIVLYQREDRFGACDVQAAEAAGERPQATGEPERPARGGADEEASRYE